MFLVIFFVCGCIWGFIEAYLFWFLEDLGSTKLTMGISLAIGTVAGIPLTIASGAIIKKFGYVELIFILYLLAITLFQKLQCHCICSGIIFPETAGIFFHWKCFTVTLFWGQWLHNLDPSIKLFWIQVLKPFGNSLLVIAAMTYAKNNASIETMASLEV